MSRKLLTRLGIAAAALVLALVAVVPAVRYWLVPFVVRRQLSATLLDRWDGSMTIGAVKANWTDPSQLKDVRLRDAAGREWLRAGSVKLTLRDWPGPHPVPSRIVVDDLDLRLYSTDGALRLPIKPAAPRQAANENRHSRPPTIPDIPAGGGAQSKADLVFLGLQLEIRREAQSYRIEIEKMTTATGEELLLSGTVKDGYQEADIDLQMKHTLGRREAAAILATLNLPFVTHADGKIDMEVNVQGRLSELPSLAGIRIAGDLALADVNMSSARGPLLTGLKGDVRFDGQAPPGAVAAWSAQFCRGPAKGQLTANILADGTMKYRGRTDAQGVDFGQLSKLLGGADESRQGELHCIYVVDGNTGAPLETVGKGYLYLEDAHLADVPLFAELLGFVGLSAFEALQATSAEATFETKGSVVNLSKAHVANSVVAIEIEPGGQVDIATRNLDLYAIVVPIKQLHDLLASIPFANMVVRLKDRLTRLRVRGDWNDRPSRLISKEPLRDIAGGAFDFLRDAVAGGGRLSKNLYDGFGERLDP